MIYNGPSAFNCFANLLGFELGFGEHAVVTHPHLELGFHYCLKYSQLFGFTGAVVGIALKVAEELGMLYTDLDFPYHALAPGLLIGAVTGPALVTTVRNSFWNFDARSKCFQIRTNNQKLYTDRCSLVGLLLGLVGASLGLWHHSLLRGAAYGYIGGFFLGSVFSGHAVSALAS